MCAPVLAEVAVEWGEQTSINPYTKILRLTSIEHQTVFNALTRCPTCAPQIPKCALNSGQIRQLTTPQICHGNLRYYAFACNVLYLSVLILIFLLCVQSYLRSSHASLSSQLFHKYLRSTYHLADLSQVLGWTSEPDTLGAYCLQHVIHVCWVNKDEHNLNATGVRLGLRE